MDCNTFFICATQSSNLGDLMINKSLIEELCNYGTVYIDALFVPDEFKLPLLENPNVRDVSSFGFSVKRLSVTNLIRYLRFLKVHKIRLITRSPGPLEEPSEKVRLGFFFINRIGQFFGARVIYFGSCCSEAIFNGKPIRYSGFNSLFVRSSESVSYAKRYCKIPIDYIPDMAFSMFNEKGRNDKKKTLAVDYRIIKGSEEIIVNDIKRIISVFLQNGYAVEFYYQVKGDKPFVEELFHCFKQQGVTLRKELVWYDDLLYYADKEFILSNRLHSLLFGAAYGAIPLARITEASTTLKIGHVFKSSLPKDLYSNIFIDQPLDVDNVLRNRNHLRDELYRCMSQNKELIKTTIRQAISEK